MHFLRLTWQAEHFFSCFMSLYSDYLLKHQRRFNILWYNILTHHPPPPPPKNSKGTTFDKIAFFRFTLSGEYLQIIHTFVLCLSGQSQCGSICYGIMFFDLPLLQKLKWAYYCQNIIFYAILINESILHVLYHSLRAIVRRVNILRDGSKYYSNFLTRGSKYYTSQNSIWHRTKLLLWIAYGIIRTSCVCPGGYHLSHRRNAIKYHLLRIRNQRVQACSRKLVLFTEFLNSNCVKIKPISVLWIISFQK